MLNGCFYDLRLMSMSIYLCICLAQSNDSREGGGALVGSLLVNNSEMSILSRCIRKIHISVRNNCDFYSQHIFCKKNMYFVTANLELKVHILT